MYNEASAPWQKWVRVLVLLVSFLCNCDATLVFQDGYIVDVVLETKRCQFCRNMRGVPGDDWQSHGYFVFGQIAVHMKQLVQVRGIVHDGTPITTAWRGQFGHLSRDLEWMDEHPDLAKR